MDINKATVSSFLDKRREKKNNTYPVKLIVYFEGEKKRYKTSISLTEEDWSKLTNPKLRDDNLRTIKRKLTNLIEKANKSIDTLDNFTFEEFDNKFLGEKTNKSKSILEELFNDYILSLEQADRIGSAWSYLNTKNSIKGFKSNVKIYEVSKEFLLSYEKYLLNKSLSPSTIGIHMRQLRRIVNVAINDGLLPVQKYPFKGYTIPSSRNIKKALTKEQVKLLLNYQTEDKDVRKAIDFWLFSYISNGINITDVCLLKPENLDKDFFSIFRAKTRNTKKKDLRPIKVPLTELSKTIIEKWRNRNSHNPYLFPVLDEGLTAKQIKYRIQDFIYFINKHMKTVAKDLGIDTKIGTYVARHTHATLLKRMGAPTELIKENLGHSSLLTTESYLDDFTDDFKKDFAQMLVDL